MNRYLQMAAGLAIAAFAAPALAVLNVFATVPEWGALAEELGGDKVKVYTATNALQDPHHVEARPSLIARARGADLVVATGAEAETGGRAGGGGRGRGPGQAAVGPAGGEPPEGAGGPAGLCRGRVCRGAPQKGRAPRP